MESSSQGGPRPRMALSNTSLDFTSEISWNTMLQVPMTGISPNVAAGKKRAHSC